MADEYSRRVARVVAAQMAELTGFEAAQESAIEVLAELLLKYIQELCTAAHTYAEQAHRTDFNICDLNLALTDMGTNMDDLKKYLDSWLAEQGPGSYDQGFVHPLPPEYPIRAPGRALPSFEEKREAPPAHIPGWMPALPDRHTYVRTPAFPGHEEDPAKQSELIRATRKQGTKTALAFKQQLLSVQPEPGDAAVDTNPFLRLAAADAAAAAAAVAAPGAAADGSAAGPSGSGAAGGAANGGGAGGAQPMDVDGGAGAAGAAGAAGGAGAGPSGSGAGGRRAGGDQMSEDEDGGDGRRARAAGGAQLPLDVLHPVSCAFEPVVGPVAEEGAGGLGGGGEAGRRDTDAAVKWQQTQEAPASGSSALGLPAGFTLDFATRVQRQGAAFGTRRAVEDAFRPAGDEGGHAGGGGGGRYTARSRASRYDIGDERKRAENILTTAAAELKGTTAADHDD